jgi:hypothetical protein
LREIHDPGLGASVSEPNREVGVERVLGMVNPFEVPAPPGGSKLSI